MKDCQKDELEVRLRFSDGAFTCVYFHSGKMRIGIERSTPWNGGQRLACFGEGCVEGGPCDHGDCPYYAEITMLALNNFRKGDEERRCRS